MKLLTITALLVGVAGACLLAFGAWLLMPAAGLSLPAVYACSGHIWYQDQREA